MSYYTLSIHAIGHDGSGSLFKDDKLILFCGGERHTRIKSGKTISEKFLKCIEKETSTIDLLILYCDNDDILSKILGMFTCKKIITKESSKQLKYTARKLELYNEKNNFSHHDAHAMSAFYISPFRNAIALIVDGFGDHFYLNNNESHSAIIAAETTSIIEIDEKYQRKLQYKRLQYIPAKKHQDGIFAGMCAHAFDGGLTNVIEKSKNLNFKCDLTTHLDIGNMYHTIAKHLNFGFTGSGKVMGLSAYGNPVNSLPPFLVDDTIYSNANLFSHDILIDVSIYPNLHDELSFQDKADMAYEVQRSLEKIFLKHAEFIKQNSKIKNLLIGGGCALNILGASIIKEKYPEFNIFVDPIANDASQSIGMGLFFIKRFYHDSLEKKETPNNIYWGPEYDLTEISKKIDQFLN